MWGRKFLDQLWQDLRYALHLLTRSPGFTAVAVISLALSIGAGTAVFSVIHELLLKTMPVRNPDELVTFRMDLNPRYPYDINYSWYERFRDNTQVFTKVTANWLMDRAVTINGPGGGEARQVRVNLASGSYFPTLGVKPLLGRTFTEDDDRVQGGHPIAVISYGFWERMFGFAPDIIGRTLTLNRLTYTVIGVVPPGFTGTMVGKPADLWIPFMMQQQVMPEVPGLEKYPTRIIARLKPGMTVDQAQAGIQLIYQQLLTEDAGPNPKPERLQRLAKKRIELESAARGISPQRKSYAQTLSIVMSAVGLVLLIACANTANLQLARSAARRKEMAVRLAMGASRWRIVRQLLTESLLLAIIGGALGLLFAHWGTKILTTIMASGPAVLRSDSAPLPSIVSLSIDVQPDLRVLTFAITVSVLTGILFGLAPAFRSSKGSLTLELTGRGTGSSGPGGRFRLDKALLVAQVALSLILMICAGLFVSTLRNLKGQNLGYDREHVILAWISPDQAGRMGPALADFSQAVRDRLAALPGVVSVGISNGGVLGGRDDSNDRSEYLRVEGLQPKPGLLVTGIAVTPRFFESVGIPLLGGRDFTEGDTETSSEKIILSETLARFLFGNENPIGKRMGWSIDPSYPFEVVGVVKDAKHGTPRDNRGVIYSPFRQRIRVLRGTWCVAVRTPGNRDALMASMRHAFQEIDAGMPVVKINTIDDQLDNVLVEERLFTSLFGFFGAMAVLLACLGLYGMISYLTRLRTNEIGLRMALGATRSRVIRMVLKESLWLVLAGILIGVPATLGITRLIVARLYGVGSADPLTLAVAALLMIVTAVPAVILPARRASRIDPMEALRHE
jgi:predicted permease